MPISTDESFRIEYSQTKGMEMEFYRGNNIVDRQQFANDTRLHVHYQSNLQILSIDPSYHKLQLNNIMFDSAIFMIIMSWPSATHYNMIMCYTFSTRDTKSILFNFYHSEYTIYFFIGINDYRENQIIIIY